MQIEKKWQIKDINPELISELSGKLNISKITAAILANRGVTNVQEAEVFLNPSFFEISNPFTLPDMEKATDRIRLALDKNEKILIYGDRDIDGVTAVSLLYLSLKRLGANVFWFIPSIEGYGLHKEIIERYLAEGVTLIITVDCGISNRDEISYAASKGVDVIVTDHHEPPDVPPDAHSLVDPKRKDSPVDFPDFAGCTVALKLAQALLMSYDELYDKELFVIDVETTGLHPYKDEICEIAAVRLFKFRKTDNFQTLVKTQGDISPEVTAIHGISNEMCKEAPEPKDAIAKFLNFIGDGVIVAHNAAFDLSFIKNYARKYLGKTLTNRVIDTLTISREFFPFRSHALGSLAKDLGLGDFHAHRALNDVEVTIKVFNRLEQLKNEKIKNFLQENLDLITIGTIGDLMPLVAENRVLTKYGLITLSKTRKVGLKLLIEKTLKSSSMNKIKSKDVSYNIVPLINACGRMERADLAVQLLIEKEQVKADNILRQMEYLNAQRKDLQEQNMSEFLKMLFEQCNVEKDMLFFITGSGMEHGVTGIIASQIVREFSRPALLLILDGDEATGAGRSIEGFNFYNALSSCSDLLVKYGGHSMAVGLTVKAENIQKLKERLLSIASERLTPEMLQPVLNIDTEIKLHQINQKLLQEIEGLEPYGANNPYPSFLLRQVKVTGFSRMGDAGAHLRMHLSQDGAQIGAVGWRKGEFAESLLNNFGYFDIVGQIEMNRWQDRDYLQLLILDIRPVL